MKLDLTSLSFDPKWYDYETLEEIGSADTEVNAKPALFVRIYPLSESTLFFRGGKTLIEGSEQLRKFTYCLQGLRGFTDVNNKPLECTDENKKLIFEFAMAGLPGKVLDIVAMEEFKKGEQEKN